MVSEVEQNKVRNMFIAQYISALTLTVSAQKRWWKEAVVQERGKRHDPDHVVGFKGETCEGL